MNRIWQAEEIDFYTVSKKEGSSSKILQANYLTNQPYSLTHPLTPSLTQ
jgi:hypothetical protein